MNEESTFNALRKAPYRDISALYDDFRRNTPTYGTFPRPREMVLKTRLVRDKIFEDAGWTFDEWIDFTRAKNTQVST